MRLLSNIVGMITDDWPAVLLVVFVGAFVWLLSSQIVSLPLVEWSLTRDECVHVAPATAGTCEDLPDRYERVWVR